MLSLYSGNNVVCYSSTKHHPKSRQCCLKTIRTRENQIRLMPIAMLSLNFRFKYILCISLAANNKQYALGLINFRII